MLHRSISATLLAVGLLASACGTDSDEADDDADGDTAADPDATCAVAADAGVNAVILPLDLDGSFRVACH